MNEIDALDLLDAALRAMALGAGPPVAAAMAIGLVVALAQALTQVQETTLTFVPKIVVIVAAFALGASTIGAQFGAFSERVYSRIEAGFGR